MTGFNKYQFQAGTTAIYPNAGKGSIEGLMYVSNGLAAEAGETVGKIAKAIRDDSLFSNGLTTERRETILSEAGDVLWFVAQLCTELGATLDDVANKNLDKLTGRQYRGTLKGEGDTR